MRQTSPLVNKSAPLRVPKNATIPDLQLGERQEHPGYQTAHIPPPARQLVVAAEGLNAKTSHGKTAAEWSHQCLNLCGARCCQYVAIEIAPPRTKADFERVRWALLHPLVAFFRDRVGWYLLVFSRCSKLLPNNACAIYDTRPTVCAEHQPWSCEYPDGLRFRVFLESDAALQRYLDRRFRRKGPWPELPQHQRTGLVIWPIATPTRPVDFDELRWAVLHRHVAFFAQTGQWFMVVDSPLEPDKRERWLEATRPTMEVWIDSQEQLREFQVRFMQTQSVVRYRQRVNMR